MKKHIVYMILFFCTIQQFHAQQEDGVVAFNLPVRNSLKFNRYAVNPTFSFVREQNKYITVSNKRQWAQFDNAPLTYMFSFSGRFKENIGAGLGVFQQDYGVLTTFGGIVNFAYNAALNTDSNLTFGMNVGFYKSGINDGKVVTNFPDPSLDNIPSNSVLTINPGINYGTDFFDFGVSINNAVSYNLTTSKMIEDNPEQGIQAHVLYTGYVDSRGFFDESKFSGLVRSEFKKDQTVISGIAMLTVPKGIWAQVGYNTLYGASAGIGLNISNQIAVEYNYEKAMGDLSTFGNSHDITLAYKFTSNTRYKYSGDDDEQALLSSNKKSKRVLAKPTLSKEEKAAIRAKAAEERANRIAAREQAKEEEKLQKDAAAEQLKLEQEAKVEAEKERLRLEEEAKVKAEEAEQLRLEQEAKAEEEERLRLEEEAKAKADEEERLQLEEEKRLREEAEQAIDTVQLDGVLVSKPTDRLAIELENLAKLSESSKIEQQELILKLTQKVAVKQQDLDDLKEENDLSEQGIYTDPKPFKSVTAENAEIESIKSDLDNQISNQETQINELERVLNERLKTVTDRDDEANAFYQRKIDELKANQLQTIQTREQLNTSLETINVATEYERKRRIRRAAYDNEQDRYEKDRATLNQIKQFTQESSVPLKEEDLDFGEERSNNIEIVKNVPNVESGYYLVLAVHDDEEKRNDFLEKVVASGQTNIDFFYDVTTNKYYIYQQKYDNLNNARNAMQSKENKPYNSKMSMVKIEN